jgi:hypothetical protein
VDLRGSAAEPFRPDQNNFGVAAKSERNPQGLKPGNLLQNTAGMDAYSSPQWSAFTLKNGLSELARTIRGDVFAV